MCLDGSLLTFVTLGLLNSSRRCIRRRAIEFPALARRQRKKSSNFSACANQALGSVSTLLADRLTRWPSARSFMSFPLHPTRSENTGDLSPDTVRRLRRCAGAAAPYTLEDLERQRVDRRGTIALVANAPLRPIVEFRCDKNDPVGTTRRARSRTGFDPSANAWRRLSTDGHPFSREDPLSATIIYSRFGSEERE